MDESRKAFEAEMEKLGECVDMRRAKNGDEEYMAWDVRLAWRFWNLSRAAIELEMPEPFKLAKSSSGLTYYYQDEVDAVLSCAGIKVKE
ncbi:TPA: hypothetical protein ACPEY2_001699 [Citrobacter amalonaticus]